MKFEVYKNEKLILGEKEMNFLEFKEFYLNFYVDIYIYDNYKFKSVIENIKKKTDVLLYVKHRRPSVNIFCKIIINGYCYVLKDKHSVFDMRIFLNLELFFDAVRRMPNYDYVCYKIKIID